MSSRKRSRWGSNSDGKSDNSNNNNNNNNSSRGTSGLNQRDALVSDQEAVRALLSSAAAASASSQPPPQEGRGRGRGGGNGPRQERRSGDGGGGVDGHYGPQSGEQRQNDYKSNVNDGTAVPRDDSKRSRWSSGDRHGSKDHRGSGDRDRQPSTSADGRNDDSAAAAPDAAKGAEPTVEKEKPNFGLSGALAKKDAGGGGSNMYKGVLLKFREPPEARAPANTYWRLYVFKGKEELETLHIAKQSAYLIGRNADICDIVIQHPSASSQHAVIQYRALPNKTTGKLQCLPYLIDLESTNGCFINGVRIDAARYYQLKKGDLLRFGASTREYVLMAETASSLK